MHANFVRVALKGNTVNQSNQTCKNSDTNFFLHLMKIPKKFLFDTIMFYTELTSATSRSLFQ